MAEDTGFELVKGISLFRFQDGCNNPLCQSSVNRLNQCSLDSVLSVHLSLPQPRRLNEKRYSDVSICVASTVVTFLVFGEFRALPPAALMS